MSRLFAPPPPFTVVGAASSDEVIQPQLYNNMQNAQSSSASSSSIVIVIIVISSAIIVSVSLYLLIRFFSRRFYLCFRSLSSAVDDVVSPRYRCSDDRNGPSNGFFESLPVFMFDSITGNISGGDCAVCLSKFEPQDLLRLLPLCCHAFHSRCIEEWLSTSQTCPLCRSIVHPTGTDVLNKLLSQSNADDRSNSFRIEIGSVSRPRTQSDSGDGRRSYSIGSFEYIVEDGYEVSAGSTHRRGASDCTSIHKESTDTQVVPGQRIATEVSAGRSWLKEYLNRFASISFSSSSISFRSSARFFTGSSRRSDVVVPVEDLQSNRIGKEIVNSSAGSHGYDM